MTRERERERCRAGPRGHTRVAHAPAHEPVDQGPGACEVEVADVHHTPRQSHVAAGTTSPDDRSTVGQHEAEGHQQAARGMGGRRAREHRDQVAPGGRADDLHRADREHPRDEAHERPLRQARTVDRDADDHAERDRRERRDHGRPIQAPGRPIADAHGEGALAARLVGRDVAQVVGHEDRHREEAERRPAPPRRGRHGLHHHERAAAGRHQPEEQEDHQLTEAEPRVRPRSAAVEHGGDQRERADEQDQQRLRREREREARHGGDAERDERGHEHGSRRGGRRSP